MRNQRLITIWVVLLLFLSVFGVTQAAGPDGGPSQEMGTATGVASNALSCLSMGSSSPSKTSGIVHLTWSGQVERARLVLGVAGTEAAHTISVNGQPVARVPVFPGGQLCDAAEYVYLDVDPGMLVQGDNRIEIADDALPGDVWSAANVRIEVFGEFALALPDPAGQTGAEGIAAAQTVTLTFSFISPYDGSSQDATAQIPDGYDPGTATPLLVAVHPRSGVMEWGLDEFGAAADGRGWLLASPQLHGSWVPDPACYEPSTVCDYEDEVITERGKPGAYAYASPESQYDVIGTVRYMVETFNVDASRIYLAGYSMGGQGTVVTAAKFPHLFAAVFDNKGPTEMPEWYDEQVTYYDPGGADQAQVRAMRKECHVGGDPKTPGENPFCYQRRSGLYFAGNYLHTPISMTHSTGDALVPVHHSRDLRDAINAHGPDQPASLFEDTIVGPTCLPEEGQHCYEPEPEAVLDFLSPFTLDSNPSFIHVTTDESKSYYWMNVVQTSGDHWSQIEVARHPVTRTVAATISDSFPLTVSLNLGSTPITQIIPQPGMGLPATTYLVKGGGNNFLYQYTSGYLTIPLASGVQFPLTISALEVAVSAEPAIVYGGQAATVTITTVASDQVGNPAPDGTVIALSTTEGTFASESSTYTTPVNGGWFTTMLTLTAGAGRADITASTESITGATSVDVISPSIKVVVTPSPSAVYAGQAVLYAYQITNDGDSTLTGVSVVDDNGTPGETSDDLTVCSNITLGAGATTNCNRSDTLFQSTTNTATVVGQDRLDKEVTDTDSATVSVLFRTYLPIVVRE